MEVSVKDIAETLGGEAALGRPLRDLGDLNAAVVAGLPRSALDRVAQRLTQNGVYVDVLSVVRPRGTADTPLDVDEGERLERVARLLATAIHVFGDEAAARAFIVTPHDRLGGRAPLALLATELGGRQVERLLDSIAYGLPA
jgi:putative toxin-antitoxin system antitoxin component (TIGR02293 family)